MNMKSPSFKVRCLRLGDSTITEQTIYASSDSQAHQILTEQGYTVLSITLAKQSEKRSFWMLHRHAPKENFALFCREIATLIHAGMTVIEAVDTLSARERNTHIKTNTKIKTNTLAVELIHHLEQGISLSNALQRLPNAPSVLIAAVRAGERTSDLASALNDYLAFDTLVQQLRRKVVSAAIYPALVTTLGIGISIFLVLVVMPNFSNMYENLRGQRSGATGWMIGLSQWTTHHREATVGGFAVAFFSMVYWIVQGHARRQCVHAAMRFPWLRRRIEDFQLAMMYQALALMLKGGYPLTDALTVAGQTLPNPDLKAALMLALHRIEQGASVAQSLADAQLCDEVGRRLMAAAERNGEFHRAADVVSRRHGQRFELFVERVTRIVEPVLLLCVAMMVGSIVVMMYLPVFDIASHLR